MKISRQLLSLRLIASHLTLPQSPSLDHCILDADFREKLFLSWQQIRGFLAKPLIFAQYLA
jgi:hypothetical protein